MAEPRVFKRAVIAMVVVSGPALYAHWQLYLPPECRGHVPKVVPFHQGMTLCPGQDAIITITIQLPGGGGKDI